MVKQADIERQARMLASEHRQEDPAITSAFWFPDPRNEEVRLVELTTQIPATPPDEALHPFYFRASPKDDMPVPTAVLLIRPEEFGQRELPGEWGGWQSAKELTNGHE